MPIKQPQRNDPVDRMFRVALHWLERIIAAVTLVALIVALACSVYRMFTERGYFADISYLLHNLLAIVVGLEFIRMLLDTTPANILEVLALAITRHVILSHDDPWSNLLSVLCIGGLFAIRRFLIRPEEMKQDIAEDIHKL